MSEPRRLPRSFVGASTTLGIGLGGLFDGIVLHQVLQWHHMLSAPVPPVTVEALQRNTLADGLFHLAAWVVTVAGIVWLARARRPATAVGATLGGGILLGWGLFNLVEGIVDHYLLAIHHVRSGPDAALYDAGALVVAAVLALAGVIVLRRARRVAARASASPRVDDASSTRR